MERRFVLGLGGLWLRLAVAFVLVALIALVVDTVLTAMGLATDITAVARQQEVSLGRSAALTSGAAFQGIGWARADLRPVFDLVMRAGAAVQVRDRSGRVVGASAGYASYPSAGERTFPITVTQHAAGGRTVPVGHVTVRFGPYGVGALARSFEAERLRGRITAGVIGALVALIVSVIVARLIIAPVEVMLTAMRARAAGDRGYRIGRVRAPGELRELLEGFNRSTDALDAMDRMRRNLVADVAHEVRTPVAILQAETEALLDGMTEPTPENLASVHGEVLRLAQMVDDLQRLSAAESAGLQLKRRGNDLAELAAEVVDRFDESFAVADVALTRSLERVVAPCDAGRIQDVVSNLLTNALKFTPAGGSVTVRTGQGVDHQAMLQVSDTGVGIPADEVPHVTERFFRSARAAGSAGSGIGLAIVSELVRAHHGQLRIASEEGVGTQVTITLPMTAGAAAKRDR